MDAAIVLQLDVGFIDFIPCLVGDADVNEDGWVNVIDAALILQLDAGIIDRFYFSEVGGLCHV